MYSLYNMNMSNTCTVTITVIISIRSVYCYNKRTPADICTVHQHIYPDTADNM